MAARVAALLLLGVVCVEFATAQLPVDCCLKTSASRFPLQIYNNHIIQENGKGCNIRATVIITKVGKRLCISHPSDDRWVHNTIKYLEKNKPVPQA